MLQEAVKKEFQKVVAAIRKDINRDAHLCTSGLVSSEYPKAMMTGKQMQNNTATINCGRNVNRLALVLSHPALTAFASKHNAACNREEVKDWGGAIQYQVRLWFKGVR